MNLLHSTYYISCRDIFKYEELLVYLFAKGCSWRSNNTIEETLCYFNDWYGTIVKDVLVVQIQDGKISIAQLFDVLPVIIEAESILGYLKRPSLYKTRER